MMIKAALSFLLGAAFLFSSACTKSEDIDFNKAQRASSEGNFKVALTNYDRAILRSPQSENALTAAREGSRIALYELKDYHKALNYYRSIILYSPDGVERLSAQKMIASIYMDNLNDYPKAIIEYHKLLELPHNEVEEIQYRLKIARSYYYANNFTQTLIEIDTILKKDLDERDHFDLLVLSANTYMANRELEKAADILIEVIKKYPDLSLKENIALSLAVCYEEQKNFNKAIKVLEELKPNYSRPEYIEVRINRLKERALNAPGARGNRK